MLNHELLISKGFKLNDYSGLKLYELVVDNPKGDFLDLLEFDYDLETMPESVVIQFKEDFSDMIVAVDVDVWDFALEDLEKLLQVL